MLILGIETSCDDTAAAVLEVRGAERLLRSGVVNSQIAIHDPYGGVVPELASRQHLANIQTVVETALNQAGVELKDIGLLAATQGPGLVGSLLVGLNFAKALALVKKIPLIGVDHLAGHLAALFLAAPEPEFPHLALAVSGGHSSLFKVDSPSAFTLLGRTRDDAAGEAFDKVAKMLGLGYPGGPAISRLAAEGNPAAIAFPRAWLAPESLDFSFSGLKTAVASHLRQETAANREISVPDICASFQEAVVEVLVSKALTAAERFGLKTVALTGGVAANPRLRQELDRRATAAGIKVCMPAPEFCTDNAAMIALAGWFRYQGEAAGQAPGLDLELDAYSRSGYLRPAGA